MINSKKTQSIVEYLLFLTMIVVGIYIGTGFLKAGVKNGLNQTQDYLQGSLPQTLDSTYQGQVITYEVPNPFEEQ
ncbi:MAG: hypothetical protein KJ977_02615 [Candidatus Omnitrophica bacterium]|nr:hypothetical protein [Candidatus Omnitrophota bacterium]